MKTSINSNRKWFKSILAVLGSFVLIIVTYAVSGFAQDQWPRQFVTSDGKVSIFQPQLDSYKGDKIGGRAAISIQPLPGVAGFEAPPDWVAGHRWAEVFQVEDFRAVAFTEEVVSMEGAVTKK